MKLRLLAVVFFGLCLAADDAKKDDVKKELKKFEGSWKVLSLEINGEKAPEDDVKKFRLVIKDDAYALKNEDTQVQAGKLAKLDSAKKPKEIDIMPTEGDNVGKTLMAIYELKDDDWKMCLGAPDQNRPTEFDSKAGSERIYIVLKRDKSS